jgi:hypothetical protein
MPRHPPTSSKGRRVSFADLPCRRRPTVLLLPEQVSIEPTQPVPGFRQLAGGAPVRPSSYRGVLRYQLLLPLALLAMFLVGIRSRSCGTRDLSGSPVMCSGISACSASR